MAEFIVIIICLALNAVLAAFEMAFVSLPKMDLLKAAKQGSKAAENLLRRRENPERTLSVIQIGISLVGALAAAVGGAGATEILEPYLVNKWQVNRFLAEALAILLVVLPLTYLSVVFGELVPKTLALRHPTKIALRGARWLSIADRLLSPVISVLEWSTKTLVRFLFPASKKAASTSESTVELDLLSPVHQQYVLNLARIENKLIEEMMIRWEDVDRIHMNDSMEKITSTIFSSGHTRLPVVDENNNITGILHTKEFLAFRDSGAQDWATIIRVAPRVRGKNSALGALRLMQNSKSHMVMIYSEVGRLQGILALEDIIEEIVGDIFDEDDDGRIQKLLASRIRTKKI